MSSPKKMTIAVCAEKVQFMDIACIDGLANCSKTILEELVDLGTKDLIPHAPEMTIHWPASTMEPAGMTSDFSFKPTCTYDDCPRELDLLLIGGPLLNHRPAGADKLFKECWPTTKVVMTTCIGSMWLASAGVLKDHRATTNRSLLRVAQQMHPDVKWEYTRWMVEKKEGGELWTSGGALAGCDMMGDYVRKTFPKPLAEFALEGLDMGESEATPDYKAPSSVWM